MTLQIGDKVQVLNTDYISSRVQVGDVGVVAPTTQHVYTHVYFESTDLYQYFHHGSDQTFKWGY